MTYAAVALFTKARVPATKGASTGCRADGAGRQGSIRFSSVPVSRPASI